MTMLAGGSEHSGRSIEVEIVTRAQPGMVWEAWTDPRRVVEWLADRVSGTLVAGDTVTWTFDHPKSEMSFRVSELTPPSRLMLESTGAVASRLEILIGPAHDGTRIQLIHSGFSEDQIGDVDFHAIASGWRLSLAVLRYYVEFHFGQSRRFFSVSSSRPSRFSPSRLSVLFRDPIGLQEWLTDGGSLGTPGGRVHLALKSGETLRGDMLADTGIDLAMAWDEIGGVLQFRALPVPTDTGARSLWIVGWGWTLSYERAQQIERSMAGALETLERILETSEAGQGALSAKS